MFSARSSNDYNSVIHHNLKLERLMRMPPQVYCLYCVTRINSLLKNCLFTRSVHTYYGCIISIFLFHFSQFFFSVCFYRILVMMRFINQFLLAFCLGGAILYAHHLQILNIIFIKIFFTHIRTFRSVPIFRSGSFKAHFPQVQMHFVLGFFSKVP